MSSKFSVLVNLPEGVTNYDVYKSSKIINKNSYSSGIKLHSNISTASFEDDAVIGDKYYYAIGFDYNGVYCLSKNTFLMASEDTFLGKTPLIMNCIDGDQYTNFSPLLEDKPSLATFTSQPKFIKGYADKKVFCMNMTNQSITSSAIKSVLNEPFGTSDFTIEVVVGVEFSTSQNNGRIIHIGTSTETAGAGIWIQRISGANRFSFGFYSGGYQSVQSFTNKNYSDYEFVNLTLSRKDGIFYFFINGELQGSISNFTTLNFPNKDIAFFSNNNNTELTKGVIYSARITRGVARYYGTNYTPNVDFDFQNDEYLSNVELGFDCNAYSGDKFTDQSLFRKTISISNPTFRFIHINEFEDGVLFYNRNSGFKVNNLNLPPLGDFTVECFLQPIHNFTSGNWMTVFSSGTFNQQGCMKLAVSTSSSTTNVTINFQIFTNTWVSLYSKVIGDGYAKMHCALTRKDGVFRCYIDGVLVATITNQTNYEMKSGFWIGNHNVSSYEYWLGTISGVRVTNRARYIDNTLEIPTDLYITI